MKPDFFLWSETNNLFWLKARCCGEAWSSEQLHRNCNGTGWWLPHNTTYLCHYWTYGTTRGWRAESKAWSERYRELSLSWRAESKAWSWETQLSLLARGKSWPKWSVFLTADQDFCVLNAIAWIDANNLGVIFYRSSGSCLGKEHPDGKSFGTVTCYYTCLWPENISLMAPSLQCLYLLCNAALCSEACSFFLLQISAILAPP